MSTHRILHRVACRVFVFGASLVLSFPAVGDAQRDPAIGNWKLNLAKSKFAPGTVPMNQTVLIEAAGQGVKVTSTTLRANGKKIVIHYNAYVDGKDYPITGSPDYDTVSLKRTGVTVEGTRKKDGRVVQTYQRVVSEDRRTMTVATTGKDASGQTLNSVAVFDRR